jgi:hypothetical protein
MARPLVNSIATILAIELTMLFCGKRLLQRGIGRTATPTVEINSNLRFRCHPCSMRFNWTDSKIVGLRLLKRTGIAVVDRGIDRVNTEHF